MHTILCATSQTADHTSAAHGILIETGGKNAMPDQFRSVLPRSAKKGLSGHQGGRILTHCSGALPADLNGAANRAGPSRENPGLTVVNLQRKKLTA